MYHFVVCVEHQIVAFGSVGVVFAQDGEGLSELAVRHKLSRAFLTGHQEKDDLQETRDHLNKDRYFVRP